MVLVIRRRCCCATRGTNERSSTLSEVESPRRYVIRNDFLARGHHLLFLSSSRKPMHRIGRDTRSTRFHPDQILLSGAPLRCPIVRESYRGIIHRGRERERERSRFILLVSRPREERDIEKNRGRERSGGKKAGAEHVADTRKRNGEEIEEKREEMLVHTRAVIIDARNCT